MRRRFGRGRRRGGAGNDRDETIDAAASLDRIAASGLAGVDALRAVDLPGVPSHAAVVGEGADGEVLVGWSPGRGGDALFAVLALACSRPGFAGRAVAIAPEWSEASRRRLGLLDGPPFEVQALAAPQLGASQGEVAPASPPPAPSIPPERVAEAIGRDEDRELFLRALAGLEGLSAKHGGAVRGVGDRVDLLLLARPLASLRPGRGGLRLELTGADRATLDLTREGLPTALDRLEGSLRKHLNDRRVRGSEEALRASLLPLLERAGGLRRAVPWPLPGSGAGPVDLVGVDADGRLTVAAARERLDLVAAGEVIDAALDARLPWPLVWSGGALPALGVGPRVLLAARELEATALPVLAWLSLDLELFQVAMRRGDGLRLEPHPLPDRGEARARAPRAASPEPAPRPAPTSTPAPAPAPEREVARDAARADVAAEPAPPPVEPRTAEAPERPAAPAESGARFEEVSLFDLDDDSGSGPSRDRDGAPRRRRRGGRRRGRRGGAAPGESEGRGGDAEASGSGRGGERDAPPARVREERRAGTAREPERPDGEDDELVDEDEGFATLADDAPEPEVAVDLRYEDEESGEEEDAEEDKARVQRELRRRARKTEPEEPPRPPRRRAAFVAHADRTSVLTAILLARDVRLVESFWVYPQEDLMTFFRSVATDLREETPIFLIGFTASPPARDTLQAASLYRGRLHWFDHHAWPPEDLVSLAESIGEDAVHIEPGSESSLASVLAERTRRSRFSDKLVELATGRFTQHDYERWGRLWWHRAGQIAGKRGDRRADIEPLLAGRPSDLAKEAAKLEPPPPPPELSFVSERDFRLVHFGGFVMVVLDVPPELDLHLAARIARERYDAQLSLASYEGESLLVLGGDETRTRRGLDLGGMAAHLAAKHEWITALRDDDHVARVRVASLRSVPGRLDEVVSEIAMGRSIVEG